MNSLQEQLLKAGLANEKDAKKLDKEKRKKNKVNRRSKSPIVDETKQQAEQTRQEKAKRDRELNRSRDQDAQKKAIAAQIKQLIDVNQVGYAGEVEYHFSDGAQIKKLRVSDAIQAQLTRGRLVIARHNNAYAVIASEVAERIAQRDESYIVLANQKADDNIDEDDPYADFQIPDDLMW